MRNLQEKKSKMKDCIRYLSKNKERKKQRKSSSFFFAFLFSLIKDQSLRKKTYYLCIMYIMQNFNCDVK